MKRISVLDCTLRDGGYCNQWKFGFDNIKRITQGLVESGIDIIECGFLTQATTYNSNISKYSTFDEVAKVIPVNREGKMFVCMINYGEYNIDDIKDYDGTSVDGIRVAFHKKDLIPALEFCKEIKNKGYKVFIQAMVSLSYSDEEFIDLIHRVNEFKPYSFYIVDSFGVMKHRDLIRLFYMVEHNLSDDISIGYHSHNNMQLAYSNAQALADVHTRRKIIFDSSVYGMGRGAGNLNTELFVEYLNDNMGTDYILKPLLNIIDEILTSFYQQNYWGYSLPNYLSAKHNSHPNYAAYLDSKKTLTVEAMDELFAMMDDNKRSVYDKEYIEDLYIKYMATGHAQESHLTELKEIIAGKDVLIIAPGRSSIEERDIVIACAQRDNVITISLNFDYPEYNADFIFLSNLRRFRQLDKNIRSKCIVTSNIPAVDVYLKTEYRDLLNDVESVRDNSGMMLIKFLIHLGVQKVLLAGFDGYSIDPTQNFANQKMTFYTQKATFEAMNEGMTEVLRNYKKQIQIEYITTPRQIIIDNEK
ncbi:MAG: aldolase catalytic domain-containing protein [Ruminococcus sp.]